MLYQTSGSGLIRALRTLELARYANTRWLRIDLRLSATDADGADVEHPSHARLRHRRSRSDDRGAVRSREALPGWLWQLVQPHSGAGWPAATVGELIAERHRRARLDRGIGSAACGGRSSRGFARVPPRKPVLRDRSA